MAAHIPDPIQTQWTRKSPAELGPNLGRPLAASVRIRGHIDQICAPMSAVIGHTANVGMESAKFGPSCDRIRPEVGRLRTDKSGRDRPNSADVALRPIWAELATMGGGGNDKYF